MLVYIHIIISFVFGIILYPFIGLYAIIFFFAGFLIDFDHVIEYAIKKKDINPFNAYKYFIRLYWKFQKQLKEGGEVKCLRRFHVFHCLEFMIILGISALFSKILLFVFLGFGVHIITDLIHVAYRRVKFNSKFKDQGRYYIAYDYVRKELLNKN